MPTKTDEYARPATPPDSSSLSTVRDAAQDCTACHLYKHATQTVYGEGPKSAPIMLVGDQPGLRRCRRQTFRWPRGKDHGSGVGRGRDRSQKSLRHERGETF